MQSKRKFEDSPEEDKSPFYEKAQRKDWHFKIFKNPKEIVEAIRDSAIKKAHVHPLRLIILGLLAGSTLLTRIKRPEVSSSAPYSCRPAHFLCEILRERLSHWS